MKHAHVAIFVLLLAQCRSAPEVSPTKTNSEPKPLPELGPEAVTATADTAAASPPGRPLTARQLCKHLFEQLADGTSHEGSEVPSHGMAQCAAQFQLERSESGEWSDFASCIGDARGDEAVGACYARFPPRPSEMQVGGVPAADSNSDEKRACEHLIEVSHAGRPGGRGTDPQQEVADLSGCIESLTRGRRSYSDQAWVKLIECMERGRTSAEINSCL
jgi:hypothetical protein